jgi:hypothetical protein
MKTITNPKTLQVIEQIMSDGDAVLVCKDMKDDFARDLAHKFPNLSECQYYWLHRKANEATTQKPPQDERFHELPVGGFARFMELFEKAGQSLKFPKLRYVTPEGTVRIQFYNGRMKVYCGQIYCGVIRQDDKFYYTKGCPENTKLLVAWISKSPIGAAVIWGHKISHCVFCGLELTDPRSVSVGYGATCASNWGLPWGDENDQERLLELVNLLENPRQAVN